VQFAGYLGYQLALMAGDCQFALIRLAGAVATGDGGCAVRGTAGALGYIEQLRRGVAGGNQNHAVVGQGGPGRGNGHLLSAAGTGGGEDAGHLAGQCTLGPQPAGLVEEVAHLPGHVAEAGWRAEDDCIVIDQFRRAGHLGLLIGLAPGSGKSAGIHGFRYPFDGDLGACDAARALGDRLGHGFDMSVH
jgi:hypothetical protein